MYSVIRSRRACGCPANPGQVSMSRRSADCATICAEHKRHAAAKRRSAVVVAILGIIRSFARLARVGPSDVSRRRARLRGRYDNKAKPSRNLGVA